MNQVDRELMKIERGFAAVEKLEAIRASLPDDDAVDAAVAEVNRAFEVACQAKPSTFLGVLKQLDLIVRYDAESIEPAHLSPYENARRLLSELKQAPSAA